MDESGIVFYGAKFLRYISTTTIYIYIFFDIYSAIG